jgi:hypothetical protein
MLTIASTIHATRAGRSPPNGKQASVIWAGVGGGRRVWRTCAFCECARQHVGAGWTVAALASAQKQPPARPRPGVAALQGIASAQDVGLSVVALDDEKKTRVGRRAPPPKLLQLSDSPGRIAAPGAS